MLVLPSQKASATHTYAGQIYWDFIETGTTPTGQTYYDYWVYVQLYYDCDGIDPVFDSGELLGTYNSCGSPDPQQLTPFIAQNIVDNSTNPATVYTPTSTYTGMGQTVPQWDDDDFADVSGYCGDLSQYGLQSTCNQNPLPANFSEVFGLRSVFYRARFRFVASAGPSPFCNDGYYFYYDECCRPVTQEPQIPAAQNFDGGIQSKMFNPADMNSSPRATDVNATVGYQFIPMQVNMSIDDPDPAGVRNVFLGPIRDGAGFAAPNPLPPPIPNSEYAPYTPPLGDFNPIRAQSLGPGNPFIDTMNISNAGVSDPFIPQVQGSFPFGVYMAEITPFGDTLAIIAREEPVYVNPALTVGGNFPGVCNFSLDEPELAQAVVKKLSGSASDIDTINNASTGQVLELSLCLGETIEIEFKATDQSQIITKVDPAGTCDPSNQILILPDLFLKENLTSSMIAQDAEFIKSNLPQQSEAEGRLIWEPKQPGIYNFSLEVISEICPFPRRFSLPIRLNVATPTSIDTPAFDIAVDCNEIIVTPDTIPSNNLDFAGPPTFEWSGPQVNTNPNNNQFVLTHQYTDNGNYPLTFTLDNGTGCVTEFDTIVQIGAGISFPSGAGPDVSICNGYSIELGTEPSQLPPGNSYQFSWTPATDLDDPTLPNPTATLENPSAQPSQQVYTVEVTDPTTGCEYTDEVSITIAPTILANIIGNYTPGNPIEACEGDDVALEAEIVGNLSTPTAYIWSNGANTQTITIPNIAPLDAGAIEVRVATANGCISEPAQVLINVQPKPEATLFGDLTACVGSDATISAQGGDFYVWTPTPDATVGGVAQVTFNDITQPTDITVQAYEGDCAGDVQDFTIYTVNVPVADFSIAFEGGDNEACARVEEVDFTYTGTQPVDEYQWQFANSALPAVSDLQNPSGIVFQEAGTFDVVLTARRANCSDESIQQVEVSATPIARFFIEDDDDCRLNGITAREEIDFFGANGTFTWQALPDGQPQTVNNQSTLNTVFATPGNKEVVLTAGIGVCEDVISKPAIVRPHPAEVQMTQDSICSGYFGNVRVLGPFNNNTQYDWYNMRNDLLVDNSRTFTTPNRLSQTTQYYVQGTNQFGCEGPTRVFEILVYPEQARDFTFSPETAEVPNAIITFEADIENMEAVNGILWQFGNREVATDEPVVVHQYEEPGTYDVALQVTDTNGCASTVLKQNILEVTESVVSAIPTAFSPNGDGLNDELIIDLQNVAGVSFMVFDRQGRKRFTSEERLITWDGQTEDGTALPEGVYVYLLEYTAYNGTAKTLTGSITIIR